MGASLSFEKSRSPDRSRQRNYRYVIVFDSRTFHGAAVAPEAATLQRAMRGIPIFLVLFASTAMFACGSSSTQPAKEVDPAAGTIHVHDGFVRDEQGRALILRGVNLAGAHKS